MKILTLNANLKGIGTYQRCFYFSRELARRGHDVTMVTVSRESKFHPRIYSKRDWIGESPQPVGRGPWVWMIEAPNWGYKWLPGWGSGPLDIWLRLREIIGGKYDVVYGFEYQPDVSWPVYLTKWWRSYRFYSDWCDWYAGGANWLHGYRWAHRIDAFWEERIRFLAEKVTVTSRVLWERALSIGIPEDNIIWIPQGVDTEYCKPYPKRASREHLGLPVDRPIVLAVRNGDMCKEVRIFSYVLAQMPEALFVAVGRISALGRLLASELGIEHSVHWTGWVPDEDYPRYIACADVCFLPLDDGNINSHANWTGKFLDYLAVGRPVVANEVGEEGILVREHDVGLLAPQDEQGFADAVVALLRDEARCHYYGENARRLMVEKWDWRARGEQIAGVVEGP